MSVADTVIIYPYNVVLENLSHSSLLTILNPPLPMKIQGVAQNLGLFFSFFLRIFKYLC